MAYHVGNSLYDQSTSAWINSDYNERDESTDISFTIIVKKSKTVQATSIREIHEYYSYMPPACANLKTVDKYLWDESKKLSHKQFEIEYEKITDIQEYIGREYLGSNCS